MGKSKIGFEVDENDLANAKAYVAKNGGSLNKLVSALFATLGKQETARAPVLDPSLKVLMSVSTGAMSITEAARRLELPDAGYVLQRLADTGLPLPRLPEELVLGQLGAARAALDDCLVQPNVTGKKNRKRVSRTAKA